MTNRFNEWLGLSNEPIKRIGGAGVREKLARLYFVRKQNQEARLSPGLGALNVPFARRFGGQPLAAQVGSDDTQSARAMAAVERLNREVDKLDQRLDREEVATKQLKSAVAGGTVGSRAQRKQGLLNKGFGITNGGINAGIMTLGKGGPKLNMGMVRNAAGKAFTATIVAHAVGGAVNGIADSIEAVNKVKAEGAKPDEMARKGTQSAMRGIIETAGSISGLTSVTKGILRIGGKTGEEAEESINSFFERMSTTREEKSRKAARVAAAIEKAVAAERDKHDREWAKLTSTPPAGFMLAGKREASTFRRDIRKMNAEQWRANRKRDEDKARKEVQLAAQGGV